MGEDTPLLFLESQGGLNPKDHVIVMHLGGQVTRIPLFFQQLKDAQELPALHTNGITVTTNLPTRVLYRPTGCGNDGHVAPSLLQENRFRHAAQCHGAKPSKKLCRCPDYSGSGK